MRPPRHARRSGLLLLAAVVCLRLLGDGRAQDAAARVAFADRMPQTVLWAWEEPEDLRTADPRTVDVAYLAETLLLGDAPTIRSRHQPLAVAPGAAVMAVVRIETGRGFRDSPELRRQTANALGAVAQQPGLRGFQIDFDATRSERAFYAAVLRTLRPQMPAGMPLSITALVSWCGSAPGDNASWLRGLPIDEAVPMFFRLGGHAQPYADKNWLPVREPLCRGSVGLSTDESWPATSATTRVYLFAPQPWSPEQLAAAGLPAVARPPALRIGDDLASARHGINDTGLHSPSQTDNDRFPNPESLESLR